MTDLAAVVSAVASSKKYRVLCEDTIRRVAERVLTAEPDGSLKAVVKATRRRLHEVYGAFGQGFEAEAVFRRLESAYRSGSPTEIESACRQVLELHQSTRERLPTIDRFYQAIWEVTGRPRTVLDLGCGLNPFALPWMDLEAGAQLIGLEIDRERVDLLNRYLVLAGMEPLTRWQDVLVHPPGDVADVALLLKMVPTLERQEPGATERLIDVLQTPHIVVSFAAKSLGGREKGMVVNYRRWFERRATSRAWAARELRFQSELVFVVQRCA
jgi:16S rRNA (guanine(1405)-N(7))-methyltransferase